MEGWQHPRDLKLMVVRQIASDDRRVAEVCHEHGLDERTLRRWRKEYAAHGEHAFLPRTAVVPAAPGRDEYVAELERPCGRLALENARLKQALGLPDQETVTGIGPAPGPSDAAIHEAHETASTPLAGGAS